MTSANQRPNVSAPTPLDWQDLVASARRSIDSQQPESRAANHRAISTAYYGAYDALCTSNAAVLVPQVTERVSADAWVRVYRGSSHGHAVGNLQRHSASLSPDGQDFAEALEDLYDARIRADYSPRSVFNRRAAERRLTRAEEAIEKLIQLPQSERAAIATITLLRDRNRRRCRRPAGVSSRRGAFRNFPLVAGIIDGLSVACIACASKTTSNKTEATPWSLKTPGGWKRQRREHQLLLVGNFGFGQRG